MMKGRRRSRPFPPTAELRENRMMAQFGRF